MGLLMGKLPIVLLLPILLVVISIQFYQLETLLVYCSRAVPCDLHNSTFFIIIFLCWRVTMSINVATGIMSWPNLLGLVLATMIITRGQPGARAGPHFHDHKQNHIMSSGCAADEPYPAPPQFKACRLQYYVQVLQGDRSINQKMLPPLSASFTGRFGHSELFAFNVTSGAERTSSLLGYARGFTIDSSYSPDLSGKSIDLVEVEYIAYDDGHFKGTFQIQAEVKAQRTNELAVMGGTRSFRGARGYGFETQFILDGDYRLFHHDLRFLPSL